MTPDGIQSVILETLGHLHDRGDLAGTATLDQDAVLVGVPEATMDRLIQRLTIKQWGETADVAHASRFLLFEEAKRITGQRLCIGLAA